MLYVIETSSCVVVSFPEFHVGDKDPVTVEGADTSSVGAALGTVLNKIGA